MKVIRHLSCQAKYFFAALSDEACLTNWSCYSNNILGSCKPQICKEMEDDDLKFT